MRIIKLTMNAFLTYKDQTVIDFEEMIEHGIYLISGTTGAGKTTIFDAITFALYGAASGSQRTQSSFRSDYASPNEETYVEMVFELHQQIYTIKRSPTYHRPDYKTAKMANAYLEHNGQTIEGVKEVNQKINQLMGVDVQQFKQIVMIAQGEFTKLIYASSEEREKVLRHVFHSETLVAFENILKEETKQLKEQYLLSSHQLASRFQLLSLPQEFMQLHNTGFHPSYIENAFKENQQIHQDYQTTLKSYESYKEDYDKKYQTYYLHQKHNQDIVEYQNLLQQYQHLDEKKEQINKLKKDIEKLKLLEKNQSMIDQYQHIQTEYQQAIHQFKHTLSQQNIIEKKVHDIEIQYHELPQLQSLKENMLIDIENLKQSIVKQKQYQTIYKQSLDIDKKNSHIQKQYQELFQTHEKLLTRMERDQERVNQLPNIQLDLQKSEQRVKEMNQRRISIHELSEFFDTYVEIQDKHYELSQHYRSKDKDYQEILRRYQSEDENFKRQQAGILALNLTDEMPCPVCGSLHHPQLASLSSQVLSSRELEELNHEVESKKAIKDEAYQEVLTHNEHIHEVLSKINLLKQQLSINEELSKEVFIKLLSDMMQVIKEQEKSYRKKDDEVHYLMKIKRSLKQDQELYQQQEKQLKIWLDDSHTLEKELTALQTQLKELQGKDDLLDNDLKKQLKEKQQKFEKLTNQIKNIEKQYHEYHNELSVITNQLTIHSQREKQLQEKFDLLKEQFDIFINQSFVSLDEFNQYQLQLKQLNQIEKKVQEYEIQKGTLLAQLETHKDMKGLKIIDLSQEVAELKNIELKRDTLLQQANSLLQTFEQNEKIIKQLEKDYTQNQDVFEKYTMYQDLSDMTSGKNAQRMSFERYVLSSYFEHILEYANIELMKMSNGRFALHRKRETKGAKQQGLDLSVLDYETGILRDIQTLSGGESFKAALSLALGLSTMVQSYAGGIELNTLFIDEGFGTLDNESIDQALSALQDMQNDNKVIGIISHVNELKERIQTQIIVEKGHQGSRLHIEKE